MLPKDEFDLTDFFFLNDVNVNNRMSSEELSAVQDSLTRNNVSAADDVIEISDESGEKNPVTYTYAKFIEILETKGLAGLTNAS